MLYKPFELLPYALNVGNYNGDVPVVVVITFCVGRVISVIGILVVVVFSFKFLLKLVECPRKELACLKCPPDAVLLLVYFFFLVSISCGGGPIHP